MTEFKRGDRISHTTHGDGQIITVHPSGNLEVVFSYKHKPDKGPLYTILPVEHHENDVTLLPRPETPLTKMVDKLDNKRPGSRGYVAYRTEVVEILNSVSRHVTFNVIGTEESGGNIRIEIKGEFTLERDLL
jgi:hypothetical protein